MGNAFPQKILNTILNEDCVRGMEALPDHSIDLIIADPPLLDAHLEGALELAEYQQKKNTLVEQKAGLQQKLSDFERKGNHWLELVRNWILDANQAKNLACTENFDEIKTFLKKIGSNQKIENQSLSIFWGLLGESPRRGAKPRGANSLKS